MLNLNPAPPKKGLGAKKPDPPKDSEQDKKPEYQPPPRVEVLEDE